MGISISGNAAQEETPDAEATDGQIIFAAIVRGFQSLPGHKRLQFANDIRSARPWHKIPADRRAVYEAIADEYNQAGDDE